MEGSDAPRTSGGTVAEVPLFPLSLVLFPHMPLPLHIFEERYREMINRCVDESRPFGVVLIADGNDVGGLAATYRIGCTARIARVEYFPDGRMLIEVVGEERFRLLDTHELLPYRVGVTEPLQDDPAEPDTIAPLGEEVERLLREYLVRSLAIEGHTIDDFELPDDPQQLSFITACILNLENEDKQELLEGTDTVRRLAMERELLIAEVTRLRHAMESMDLVQVEWEPLKPDAFDAYRCPN